MTQLYAAARIIAADTESPIHHSIYITLKDNSEEAIQRQLELGA